MIVAEEAVRVNTKLFYWVVGVLNAGVKAITFAEHHGSLTISCDHGPPDRHLVHDFALSDVKELYNELKQDHPSLVLDERNKHVYLRFLL